MQLRLHLLWLDLLLRKPLDGVKLLLWNAVGHLVLLLRRHLVLLLLLLLLLRMIILRRRLLVLQSLMTLNMNWRPQCHGLLWGLWQRKR
jgi:hypothetical protein